MAPRISPSSRAFPTELVDHIIDHAHNDQAALARFALVARAWVSGSRFHLFSTAAVSYENGREFLRLLAAPRCTFATSVHRIDVRLVQGSQKWFVEFSKRLTQLNRVTVDALGLTGSRPTVLREEARSATLNFYPQLRQLVVGPLVIERFSDFAALLAGLRGLQALDCAASFQVAPDPRQLQHLRPPSRLQSVELTSPSIRPVLWFLGGALASVANLSLVFMTQDDYAHLRPLLERPNTTLRSLRITMDARLSGVGLGTFVDRVRLTHLTALKYLDIQTSPCLPPSLVLNMLNSIASTHLRELRITACIADGIAHIDRLLTDRGGRFKRLERVAILGENASHVRQYMPRCASYNILYRQ